MGVRSRPADYIALPGRERKAQPRAGTSGSPADTGSVDEDSVRRRMNRHVLLLYCVLTFLNYTDRANLAFAAIQLNAELGFDARVYGLGAGMFYVGYSLLQIPSNLVLGRVGAPLWLGISMVAWGILATSMAAMKSAGSFYVLRFFLGVTECGTFPGQFYHSKLFYTNDEVSINQSWITASQTLAQVIGGPMAAALLLLDGRGGLAGWQWLFIAEGVPTIIFGFYLWWALPRSPLDCGSWASEEEMQWMHDRMEREREAIDAKAGGQSSPWDGIANWKVWTTGIIDAAYKTTTYAIIYWLPLIVAAILGGNVATGGTGGSSPNPAVVVLLAAVPFALAAAIAIVVAAHSKKTGERTLHIVVPLLLGCVGLGLLAWLLPISPAGAFAALMFATLVWGPAGLTTSIPALYLQGQAAVTGFALANTIANSSGFFGPYLIGALRQSSGDYTAAIAVLAGIGVVAAMGYSVFIPHVSPRRNRSVEIPKSASASSLRSGVAEERRLLPAADV